MKLPRPFAAIVSVVITSTFLVSCSDGGSKTRETTHFAPPGQFSTITGIGPSGGPDSDPAWFEDPIDLATTQNGAILALTKEYSRVFSVSLNGTRHQQFTLPTSGEALSMVAQPDGTITVVQKSSLGKLVVEQVQKGKAPTTLAELPAAKNPLSVHLILSPDGKILLLKDGWFLQETTSHKFQPLPRFKGIDAGTPVLTAAADGDSLLVVLPDNIVWIRGNRTERRIALKPPVYPEDGAAVAPDGSGGAYLTGRTIYVDHVSAQKRGSILLGIAHTSSACGNGRLSGVTGDAREHPLGEATALSIARNQLYVADPLCHRILTIGLPAKEYILRGH